MSRLGTNHPSLGATDTYGHWEGCQTGRILRFREYETDWPEATASLTIIKLLANSCLSKYIRKTIQTSGNPNHFWFHAAWLEDSSTTTMTAPLLDILEETRHSGTAETYTCVTIWKDITCYTYQYLLCFCIKACLWLFRSIALDLIGT